MVWQVLATALPPSTNRAAPTYATIEVVTTIAQPNAGSGVITIEWTEVVATGGERVLEWRLLVDPQIENSEAVALLCTIADHL